MVGPMADFLAVVGIVVFAHAGFKTTWQLTLPLLGYAVPGYTALYTLILNAAVAVVLTALFKALKFGVDRDETVASDYQRA